MSTRELIKQASIFSGLNDDHLQKILDKSERRQVASGDLVFEEGEKGKEVFVVLEGRVQISVAMRLASEQAPVHTVTPGKIFGEFALVTDHERTASARAVKDSSFLVLSRKTFHELVDDDPELGYIVLRDLSEILVGRLIKTTRELRASLLF